MNEATLRLPHIEHEHEHEHGYKSGLLPPEETIVLEDCLWSERVANHFDLIGWLKYHPFPAVAVAWERQKAFAI
jgi:hypothetical protein